MWIGAVQVKMHVRIHLERRSKEISTEVLFVSGEKTMSMLNLCRVPVRRPVNPLHCAVRLSGTTQRCCALRLDSQIHIAVKGPVTVTAPVMKQFRCQLLL